MRFVCRWSRPTGSSDPFALRRSAIGIVAMLSGKDAVEVSLVAAIDAALDLMLSRASNSIPMLFVVM